MNQIKQNISNLSLRADQILSRADLKRIVGGFSEELPGGGGATACLGCATTQECKEVGKGTCDYCSTHAKNCCSGWHND